MKILLVFISALATCAMGVILQARNRHTREPVHVIRVLLQDELDVDQFALEVGHSDPFEVSIADMQGKQYFTVELERGIRQACYMPRLPHPNTGIFEMIFEIS
jgi:hypothetical protein